MAVISALVLAPGCRKVRSRITVRMLSAATTRVAERARPRLRPAVHRVAAVVAAAAAVADSTRASTTKFRSDRGPLRRGSRRARTRSKGGYGIRAQLGSSFSRVPVADRFGRARASGTRLDGLGVVMRRASRNSAGQDCAPKFTGVRRHAHRLQPSLRNRRASDRINRHEA